MKTHLEVSVAKTIQKIQIIRKSREGIGRRETKTGGNCSAAVGEPDSFPLLLELSQVIRLFIHNAYKENNDKMSPSYSVSRIYTATVVIS